LNCSLKGVVLVELMEIVEKDSFERKQEELDKLILVRCWFRGNLLQDLKLVMDVIEKFLHFSKNGLQNLIGIISRWWFPKKRNPKLVVWEVRTSDFHTEESQWFCGLSVVLLEPVEDQVSSSLA
jgi:hypothetical protein